MTTAKPMHINALILAGSRPGGDLFAQAHGVPFKALIPVNGKPMLAHVAKALLDHPAIKTVTVAAQDIAALRAHPDLANMDLLWAESDTTIATTLELLLANGLLSYPLLITTADNVLLDNAIIDDFLMRSLASDLAAAMVEKSVLLASYPEAKRTWLKLRGGQYSGANLFWFGSPKARQILRYWAEIEQDRKKGWKIFTIFGPLTMVVALARIISIHALAQRVSRRLDFVFTVAEMPQARACIDVDKEADLVLAEQILAAR